MLRYLTLIRMNLRFLSTLLAVAEHPSFISAANALGLSHSAVSLQIKALEDELGILIVDRSTRPPTLTDDGLALVGHARRMIGIASEMRSLAQDNTLTGQVTIGVVPSALTGLIPPALARLRDAHPQLQVRIVSGLSGDLAQATRSRDIDLAVVTEPKVLTAGLMGETICSEPLDVIMPASIAAATDAEALTHPFIWFSRRTWAGQQIEEHLTARRLLVRPVLEIDSIEAIEALVRHGLGVSITPRRFGLTGSSIGIRRLPFGKPQLARTLSLISLERSPRRRLVDELLSQLRKVTDQASDLASAPNSRQEPHPGQAAGTAGTHT